MVIIKYVRYLLHEQLGNCWEITYKYTALTYRDKETWSTWWENLKKQQQMSHEKYASPKKMKRNQHYTWQTVIICIILFTATVDLHESMLVLTGVHDRRSEQTSVQLKMTSRYAIRYMISPVRDYFISTPNYYIEPNISRSKDQHIQVWRHLLYHTML